MDNEEKVDPKDETKPSDEPKTEQPSAEANPEIIELGESEKNIIKKIIENTK